jgi:hypothetical protein
MKSEYRIQRLYSDWKPRYPLRGASAQTARAPTRACLGRAPRPTPHSRAARPPTGVLSDDAKDHDTRLKERCEPIASIKIAAQIIPRDTSGKGALRH